MGHAFPSQDLEDQSIIEGTKNSCLYQEILNKYTHRVSDLYFYIEAMPWSRCRVRIVVAPNEVV